MASPRQEHRRIYFLAVRKSHSTLPSDSTAKSSLECCWGEASWVELHFPTQDDEVVEEMEETEEINEATEEATTQQQPDPQDQVVQLNRERAARERSIPNVTDESDFLGKVALSPNPNSLPKGILPACVIFLQATDAFLFNRVLRIPNDEVRCSHNDEEGFLRRLLIYRHAHAGSEVAALMASGELRKALDSEYLKKITAGEASTLTSTEQIVPLMAGSIATNTLCAFFEDRGVRAFNFDVETDTSGVSWAA